MIQAKKGCVMVVDDEPDIVLVLGEFLANEGFKTLTARSGHQALEKIKEYKIDLILLDIAMPTMNGIDTLKEIKKMAPEIPVIMITAYRDAEKVTECFRLGAYDCIFKPFDLKYLRKSIMTKLLE